jgi:spore maturation protein CgeB
MVAAGWSPSVRLFEAGACGAPVISDAWPGLETLFAPDREIVIAGAPEDVLAVLTRPDDADRDAMASAARVRVLAEHTSAHRAAQLERDLLEAAADRPVSGGSTRKKMLPLAAS